MYCYRDCFPMQGDPGAPGVDGAQGMKVRYHNCTHPHRPETCLIIVSSLCAMFQGDTGDPGRKGAPGDDGQPGMPVSMWCLSSIICC